MDRERSRELLWGRRYLMVRPDHFCLAYVINLVRSWSEE